MLQECYNTLNANSTEAKILDFEDIDDGWHFGEGVVLSRRAIQEACLLHDTLLEHGFYETDAFPGLAGEIRVTAYWKDYYFEFTRERGGKWRYIEEVNGVEIENLERDNLNLSEAQMVVEEIAQRLWNTFATSQEGTGTKNCNDFKALFLSHHQTEESPLWSGIAPWHSDPSVNIYDSFIRSQVNPQFFGNSPRQFYRMGRQLYQHLPTPTIHATGRSWELTTEAPREYSKPIAGSQKIASLVTLKYVQAMIQGPSLVQTFPLDDCIAGQGQVYIRYPASSLQLAEPVNW